MKTWLKPLPIVCAALLLAGAGAGSAQLADKRALTLEAAKRIAAAAEKEAAANKYTMVIAILDDGGNLLPAIP